jgi:hypothetical protein
MLFKSSHKLPLDAASPNAEATPSRVSFHSSVFTSLSTSHLLQLHRTLKEASGLTPPSDFKLLLRSLHIAEIRNAVVSTLLEERELLPYPPRRAALLRVLLPYAKEYNVAEYALSSLEAPVFRDSFALARRAGRILEAGATELSRDQIKRLISLAASVEDPK